jgi:two-component sensor histidine kinase
MLHDLRPVQRPHERPPANRYPGPELVVDLEADNVLLRAALAKSEGAGERRDLTTRELSHRIGNLLAVVQAIARNTFRHADPASLEDFTARLHALAAAQKLLIDTETRAALIGEVISDALAPHCADGNRATISGPDIPLDGRRAHALTLALHELATNAAKYGALSVDEGGVEVVWTKTDDRLELLWREHGGPPVVPPRRSSFGSLLITRNLGVAFSGESTLAFEEGGVECRLKAPLLPSP